MNARERFEKNIELRKVGARLDVYQNRATPLSRKSWESRLKEQYIIDHGGSLSAYRAAKSDTAKCEIKLQDLLAEYRKDFERYQVLTTDHSTTDKYLRRLRHQVAKHGLDRLNERQRIADAKYQRNLELTELAGYVAPIYLGPGPHPSPEQQYRDFWAMLRRQRAKELQPQASVKGTAALAAKGRDTMRRVLAGCRQLETEGVPEHRRAAILAERLGVSGARVRQIIAQAAGRPAKTTSFRREREQNRRANMIRKVQLAFVLFFATNVWSVAKAAPPAAEVKVIQIVDSYSAKFTAAANDMQRGAIAHERAAALCAVLSPVVFRAKRWTGKIETLDATDSGKGILAISIAPHVSVMTDNTELGDSLGQMRDGMSTLISAGSKLFRTVSAMRVGEAVEFSGQFSRDKDRCLDEMSLTIAGSMSDPDFRMRFTAVSSAK